MVEIIDIFKNGWKCGGAESPCGSGSTLASTVSIRAALPWILAGMSAERGGLTVVDVGAGDMHWIREVLDRVRATNEELRYVPLDLVPRNRGVRQFNILEAYPPIATLIICRDVLIHFPNAEAMAALQRMRDRCRYFLSTCYPGVANIPRHDWTADPHKCFAPIDLMAPPFNLGVPLLMLPEPNFGRFVGLWKGNLQ